MNKVIVILGQTSTGKSDFAVEIARQINGEIISADSRQVYRGMDLGTGKITKKEMRGIPHYLLDVVTPRKVFSVSDFQNKASKRIEEIIKKDRIPIICGGTGFYIDSLINNVVLPEVPPNKKLRKELTMKETAVLVSVLEKLDPKRAKNIDKNNRVRLIRAIEIAKSLGKVPLLPQVFEEHTNSARAEFVCSKKLNVLKIGLILPPDILKERIYSRIINRIKKGMIKEVENLHKKGLSWKRMSELGLEYRYISLYLRNKMTKDEMINKLNTETWHYAKRQNTWFKRDQNIFWINPIKKSGKMKAVKEIKEFLK